MCPLAGPTEEEAAAFDPHQDPFGHEINLAYEHSADGVTVRVWNGLEIAGFIGDENSATWDCRTGDWDMTNAPH